jgi:hypothetical protein
VLATLAVGLYAATTVAPAAAGTHSHEAEGCEATIFDGLNSLGSAGSSARVIDLREPALNQVVQELPASAKGKGRSVVGTVVPVFFHVVHAGGVGNISDAIIKAQMNVLNSAFAGFYGGAATGFSFELAGVTRTDNAAGTTQGRHERRARDEEGASPRRLGRIEPLRDDGRCVSRLGVLPGSARVAAVPRRDRGRLGVDATGVAEIPRLVRPRSHGHARGGPLVPPPPHLPGGL